MAGSLHTPAPFLLCVPWSSGEEDGQFNDPRGVAVDLTRGVIAVADFQNNRVQVFSREVSEGLVPAKLKRVGDEAQHIALIACLYMLVLFEMSRPRKENSDSLHWQGAFIHSLTHDGPSANRLRNPTDVAIDGTGKIVVADSGSHRSVWICTPAHARDGRVYILKRESKEAGRAQGGRK